MGGPAPMPTEDARKRLIGLASAAREGAARFPPERAAGPPAPGDLFVLAATSGLPVEWAVLDRRTGRPGFSGKAGELLVVPADTQPSAGSAAVEVPGGAPGGPRRPGEPDGPEVSSRCKAGHPPPGAGPRAAGSDGAYRDRRSRREGRGAQLAQAPGREQRDPSDRAAVAAA